MDNSFNSIIDSANSLVVLLPTRPYFDQVAAGLSLYLSLKDKKDVQVYSPSPMTVGFNRLVGVNKVVKELGNKNLVLRFSNYPADNIERVSYDIEDGQFKLTVIPKPGISSPKKEEVNFSYSGVSADTAILVGGAAKEHFPALDNKDMVGVKLVHLGTRELASPSEISIMSFARPASSVSEIVTSLLKDNGFEINHDIATNLIMGIEEGSKNFSSDEVTAETFELFAYLLRKGGKRAVSLKMPKRSQFPKGAIPGQFPVRQKVPVPVVKREPQREESKDVPKDWTGPKIYKGDTIS